MAKRTVVPEGMQKIRVATGIYLKRNGKYLVYFRDPGHQEHWEEFTSFRDAKLWRARAIVDPKSALSGRRPLGEVWEQLLDDQAGKLRPTTLANWKQEWRVYIGPALGSWPVGKITVSVVKRFLADLERDGAGTATRQKCRSILHRIFEEAVENGEVASNPVSAKGTRIKPSQPKKARILKPTEVAALVEAASKLSGPTDALAIETMFWLGLRIGELAGLQARDVDPQRGEITVQRTVSDTGGHLEVQNATKTNKYRVLPIPEPLKPRLVSHLKEKGLIGQAPLFPALLGGPIRPNNWRRRIWAAAAAEAKIQDPPTPHAGRRTTASLLSAAGVAPGTIRAILGHSTLQQTSEYIDVSQEEMQAAMRKLEAVYAGP